MVMWGGWLILREALCASFRGRFACDANVPIMSAMQSRLQQEQDRCLHYLDSSSRRPLLYSVEQQLLAAHVGPLLAKGFKPLMTPHRCATWLPAALIMVCVEDVPAWRFTCRHGLPSLPPTLL